MDGGEQKREAEPEEPEVIGWRRTSGAGGSMRADIEEGASDRRRWRPPSLVTSRGQPSHGQGRFETHTSSLVVVSDFSQIIQTIDS